MRLLAEQTVRGVATGVVGVAIMQCVLAGIGFYVVGIPGAALLALVCLLMGIIQLPLAIPIVPVIIYVWTHEPVLTAVLFTAWSVPVMALDNVLKPILMGRGVDAPMLDRLRRRDRGLRVLRHRRAVRRRGRDGRRLRAAEGLARSRAARSGVKRAELGSQREATVCRTRNLSASPRATFGSRP